MTRFPTAAHLVSWAKFAPIDRNSAGHKVADSTGQGNPWLAGTLGEIVAAAVADRHLPRRPLPAPRPPARQEPGHRRGRQLGPDHHLAPAVDPDARYHDLGSDFYQTKLNTHRRERDLIRQLEHLTGKKVTLEAPPQPPD